MTETTTLAALATRVGAYRWLELRLFELTGRWAADGGDPAVQVHLGAASFEHAWHAELWEDRLPVLAGVDGAALTAPPSSAAATAVERLGGTDDPVCRLAGLYRVVLPRLLVTYDAHRRATGVAADAPVRRALTLVRRDETAQWRAGEALCQRLLSGPGAVGRAGTFTQALEGLLAPSPGIFPD